MRRNIVTMIILTFCLSFSTQAFSQLDVSLDQFIEMSGVADQELVVSLNLTQTNPVTPIDAFGFTVKYPTGLLTFDRASSTGTLTDGWLSTGGSDDVTPGDIIVGGFHTTATTGAGVLINLVFKESGNPGSGKIEIDAATFADDLTGATTDTDKGVLNNPVPVELATFSAQSNTSLVTLSWTTATESNNFGFDVERSVDAVNYAKIGFVQGNGNSQSLKKYTFSDVKINADVEAYYYRLKQIDTDGSFEYSAALQVALAKPESFALGQNYPNPFNPETTISYELPSAALVTLNIYNMRGQVIRSLVNNQMSAGYHTIAWNGKNDLGQNVASGTYIYQLKTDGFSDIKRLTLLR